MEVCSQLDHNFYSLVYVANWY